MDVYLTMLSFAVEFIGYTARAASYDRTGKLMPYVIQSVFILIGPALFAATIYMMLGRIVIHTNGEAYCRMPVRWLTKCFVGFDVLSLLLQAASASFTVTNIAPAAGKAMVLGGLVIQLVAFGGFCYVAAVYYRGFARAGLVKEDVWMMTMRMLFVISGLIMARSTFRVVEYSMGADGYLLTHEWPLYCFDAIPMATVMSAFFWWYPECLGRQVARSTDQEGGW